MTKKEAKDPRLLPGSSLEKFLQKFPWRRDLFVRILMATSKEELWGLHARMEGNERLMQVDLPLLGDAWDDLWTCDGAKRGIRDPFKRDYLLNKIGKGDPGYSGLNAGYYGRCLIAKIPADERTPRLFGRNGWPLVTPEHAQRGVWGFLDSSLFGVPVLVRLLVILTGVDKENPLFYADPMIKVMVYIPKLSLSEPYVHKLSKIREVSMPYDSGHPILTQAHLVFWLGFDEASMLPLTKARVVGAPSKMMFPVHKETTIEGLTLTPGLMQKIGAQLNERGAEFTPLQHTNRVE